MISKRKKLYLKKTHKPSKHTQRSYFEMQMYEYLLSIKERKMELPDGKGSIWHKVTVRRQP